MVRHMFALMCLCLVTYVHFSTLRVVIPLCHSQVHHLISMATGSLENQPFSDLFLHMGRRFFNEWFFTVKTANSEVWGFTLIARTSKHEVIRTSRLFCTKWVVTCDTYRSYLQHHLLMNSEWVMNQCWLVRIPVPNSIPGAGTTMNQMQVQSSGVQGSCWKHNKVVWAACCWEPELDCDFDVHDLWIFWFFLKIQYFSIQYFSNVGLEPHQSRGSKVES